MTIARQFKCKATLISIVMVLNYEVLLKVVLVYLIALKKRPTFEAWDEPDYCPGEPCLPPLSGYKYDKVSISILLNWPVSTTVHVFITL